MKWKQVNVLTEGICVEAIAGIFHRLGSGGVVIEDPQAARYIKEGLWEASSVSPDFIEHDFVVVKAYFPEEREIAEEISSCMQKVEENFKIQCKIFIDEVKDEDWEHSWKKYYHTFKVGNRLVIKPTWEEYHPENGEVIIEIDPGMAFGTGIHASTRFCLRFIDQYVKGGEKIIDAGCGSGILSIAAARLGAAQVFGIDIDEVAVKVASENVALNGLEDKVEIKAGDITNEIRNKSVNMVLANITAEVLVELIPSIAEALLPGGYFFGSGIVDTRWPMVEKQILKYGLAIEQVLNDVDWIGVAAKKL